MVVSYSTHVTGLDNIEYVQEKNENGEPVRCARGDLTVCIKEYLKEIWSVSVPVNSDFVCQKNALNYIVNSVTGGFSM
jgi:hypothetical protein